MIYWSNGKESVLKLCDRTWERCRYMKIPTTQAVQKMEILSAALVVIRREQTSPARQDYAVTAADQGVWKKIQEAFRVGAA